MFFVALFFVSQNTKLADMGPGEFLEAKQLGYSDIQISQRTGAKENEVWRLEQRPLGGLVGVIEGRSGNPVWPFLYLSGGILFRQLYPQET